MTQHYAELQAAVHTDVCAALSAVIACSSQSSTTTSSSTWGRMEHAS